ncbi:MAG: hypothetical protein RLZZ436_1044 [Planctomycetota bacterium]
MSWWTTAIYDTCSLITLDKLLQERRSLSRCFPKKLLALEVSLTADQMYADTATRMRELVNLSASATSGSQGVANLSRPVEIAVGGGQVAVCNRRSHTACCCYG